MDICERPFSKYIIVVLYLIEGCGTYGGEQKSVYGFGRKNRRKQGI
jgi:hypothetical protein